MSTTISTKQGAQGTGLSRFFGRLPMPRVFLLAGGTLVVLAGLTYGVVKANRPPAPVQFVTAPIRQGNLTLTYSATGELLPTNSMQAALPSGATLSSLRVTVGQTVKQGAVLATFSDPTLTAQLSSANAALLKAQNQLAATESPSYQAQASSTIQQANANLSAAEAQVAADEQAVSALTVKSTTSGPVKILVSSGQAVTSNEPLAQQGSVTYTSPASGTVAAVRVASGSSVGPGTVLVQLSDAALQARLASDQSQVAQDQVNLQNAQQSNSASAIAAAIAVAKASVLSQQNNVQSIQQNISALTVTAPFAGEVVYAEAPPTPAIAKVVTLDSLTRQVTIPIPESELTYVHTGQAVSLTLPAYPGRTFPGQVASITPTGVYTNGVSSFNVIIDVTGQAMNGIAYYGLSADANISLQTVTQKLIVPLAALRTKKGHTFIRIMTSSKTDKPVRVNVLLETSTAAAVFSPALHAGQSVVIATPSTANGKLKLRTKGRAVHKKSPGAAKGKRGKGRKP